MCFHHLRLDGATTTGIGNIHTLINQHHHLVFVSSLTQPESLICNLFSSASFSTTRHTAVYHTHFALCYRQRCTTNRGTTFLVFIYSYTLGHMLYPPHALLHSTSQDHFPAVAVVTRAPPRPTRGRYPRLSHGYSLLCVSVPPPPRRNQ
jgi:hypothetical protein